MGLIDRWRRSRVKQPVDGSFTVAALLMRARTPGFFRVYDVDGVVAADGIEPTPVRKKGVMVRDAEPLQVGQVFPATVDRTDTRRVLVDFPSTEQRPADSSDERAAAARRLAAEMSADGTGDPDPTV